MWRRRCAPPGCGATSRTARFPPRPRPRRFVGQLPHVAAEEVAPHVGHVDGRASRPWVEGGEWRAVVGAPPGGRVGRGEDPSAIGAAAVVMAACAVHAWLSISVVPSYARGRASSASPGPKPNWTSASTREPPDAITAPAASTQGRSGWEARAALAAAWTATVAVPDGQGRAAVTPPCPEGGTLRSRLHDDIRRGRRALPALRRPRGRASFDTHTLYTNSDTWTGGPPCGCAPLLSRCALRCPLPPPRPPFRAGPRRSYRRLPRATPRLNRPRHTRPRHRSPPPEARETPPRWRPSWMA